MPPYNKYTVKVYQLHADNRLTWYKSYLVESSNKRYAIKELKQNYAKLDDKRYYFEVLDYVDIPF